MSGKRKKKQGPSPAERLALFKRRVGLGGYLLFLALCLLGILAGPWWQVSIDARPFGDPMTGSTYRATVVVEEPGEAGEAPQRRVEPATLRPYALAALGCVIAFFFASYDLVADDDIQLPVFLASLGVCAVAGYVLYDVFVAQSTLRQVVELVEARRLLEGARAAAVGDGSGVAAVGSAALPSTPTIALQPGWGLALFVSSSLAMLVDSAYLTFVARRDPRT